MDDIQEDDELDSNDLWRRVCGTAMELLVHYGLLNAVVGQYPPHVRAGLVERMERFETAMQHEIEIVLGFGEAFDESSDE